MRIVLLAAALICSTTASAGAQTLTGGWSPTGDFGPPAAYGSKLVRLGEGEIFDPALEEAGWTTRKDAVGGPFLAAGSETHDISAFAQPPGVPPYFEATPVDSGIPENLGDYAPELAPGQEYYHETPQGTRPAATPQSASRTIRIPARSTMTWLPAGSGDLGWFDFEFRGIDFGDHDDWFNISGFSIIPGVGVHFLNGPTRTDLPPRLYDVYAEFRYMTQLSRQLGLEVAIAPSWFTDGDNTGSDAFRLVSRVVGFYAVSYETQFVAGVTYLDREDITALPVLGVIHATEDRRFELVFPRPRVAVRLDGTPESQRWAYVAGEFGGGSWAIERRNRRDDVASYVDWRLIFGIEAKETAHTRFAEVGFVFNRELEYKSGRGDFDPDPTAMFRLGGSY